MVEVIAIFGFLGWLFLALLGWLRSLSAFPAIMLAFVLCPLLTMRDYSFVRKNWRLGGVLSGRSPLPPERFYWPAQQCRLRRRIWFFGCCSILAWANAVLLPASMETTLSSITGWLNAAVGIFALSRTAGAIILFFETSQWFDAMRPNVVGILRRAMYRLSDNYEYLGRKRKDPEEEEVY
jgi:hypothetical protein